MLTLNVAKFSMCLTKLIHKSRIKSPYEILSLSTQKARVCIYTLQTKHKYTEIYGEHRNGQTQIPDSVTKHCIWGSIPIIIIIIYKSCLPPRCMYQCNVNIIEV